MIATQSILEQIGPWEYMDYDVVVVGADPAGLSTAIRLKQLSPQVSVVVIEKGAEPGAHILSGAVIDPNAITELFPDWKYRGAPLIQSATGDEVLFLTENGSRKTTLSLIPECFRNDGNYVNRPSALTKWLAELAEALDVEIFPGCSAAEVLLDNQGRVNGVATGNMGIGKEGKPTDSFQLGMRLQKKYTVLAEGARGHLGKQLIAKFGPDEGKDPQTYAVGIKDLWEVPPATARPGLVAHTAGWPMNSNTYGGGFLYHLEGNKVTSCFVTGLDYQSPWLSPFEEMPRWKTHASIRMHLTGGKRRGCSARAITAGGILSLPRLTFPGGALVGCVAGTLNTSRIKGSHAAIKTGMLSGKFLHPLGRFIDMKQITHA